MTEGTVHTQVDGSFFYEMKKGTGPFFIFSETMELYAWKIKKKIHPHGDGFGAHRACGDTCGDKLHQLQELYQRERCEA